MLFLIASDVVTRTTLNIDEPILQAVKRIQKEENRSLGQVVSRLLSEALSKGSGQDSSTELGWISRPMQARVDLADKEAVFRALDERDGA